VRTVRLEATAQQTRKVERELARAPAASRVVVPLYGTSPMQRQRPTGRRHSRCVDSSSLACDGVGNLPVEVLRTYLFASPTQTASSRSTRDRNRSSCFEQAASAAPRAHLLLDDRVLLSRGVGARSWPTQERLRPRCGVLHGTGSPGWGPGSVGEPHRSLGARGVGRRIRTTAASFTAARASLGCSRARCLSVSRSAFPNSSVTINRSNSSRRGLQMHNRRHQCPDPACRGMAAQPWRLRCHPVPSEIHQPPRGHQRPRPGAVDPAVVNLRDTPQAQAKALPGRVRRTLAPPLKIREPLRLRDLQPPHPPDRRIDRQETRSRRRA
jgi:hypothetical protein